MNRKNEGKRRTGIFLVIACLAMIFSMFSPVSAEDTGSLQLILEYQKNNETVKMNGGDIELYYVAHAEDSAYVINEDFRALISDDLLKEILVDQSVNAKTAGSLDLNGIEPLAVQTADNGSVFFDDLEQGIYLVCQASESDEGCRFLPFFISIPFEGKLNAVARPKPGKKEEPPVPTNPPGTSPTPGIPTATPGVTPVPGKENELPYTGQLWWPVPLLGCAGAVLLILGIYWYRKGEGHEA